MHRSSAQCREWCAKQKQLLHKQAEAGSAGAAGIEPRPSVLVRANMARIMAGMLGAAVCSLQSPVDCSNKQGNAHTASAAAQAKKIDISQTAGESMCAIFAWPVIACQLSNGKCRNSSSLRSALHQQQ